MKRMAALCVVLVVLLCGCNPKQADLDRALALRTKLLNGQGCQFTAAVTADYGDVIYTFTLDCIADRSGNVSFTVVQPQSISGVTGFIDNAGGKLTFEQQALAFPLLADGQFSPVSSPWILVKTLRSGYLTACAQQGEQLVLSVDDSYEDDALHLEIRLGSDDIPQFAEILWDGRRVLSMEIRNFRIL